MQLVSEITDIAAPSSVNPGDSVTVDVSVKNMSGQAFNLAVSGVFNSSPISFQFDYLNVLPQETVIMRGDFVMPNATATVDIWLWYWNNTQWIWDDQRQIIITAESVSLGWREMLSSPVTLAVNLAEPVSLGWQKMLSAPVYLAVGLSEPISGGWVKMLSSPVTLPVVLPGGGGDGDGGGTNWLPVALIGAGAVVVAAATIPKKNRDKIVSKVKETFAK